MRAQPAGTIIAFADAKSKIPNGWVVPGHTHPVARGWSIHSDGDNKRGGGELTNGGLAGDRSHIAQTSVTGISINSFGGLEVRPKNAYVYYMIKL